MWRYIGAIVLATMYCRYIAIVVDCSIAAMKSSLLYSFFITLVFDVFPEKGRECWGEAHGLEHTEHPLYYWATASSPHVQTQASLPQKRLALLSALVKRGCMQQEALVQRLNTGSVLSPEAR